jgi:hypothetical protein
MAYHLRCPKCTQHLYCSHCGEPIDADAHIPGQVGKRHTFTPFNPAKRSSWAAERGRILKALKANHPTPMVAREIWALTHLNGSSNQTCTRLGELNAEGLAMRSGGQHLTETNTPADEWVLTPAGLHLFRRILP